MSENKSLNGIDEAIDDMEDYLKRRGEIEIIGVGVPDAYIAAAGLLQPAAAGLPFMSTSCRLSS